MRKTFMGVRLRRLREEHSMTQAALARALEISPSYLNQIEQNQRPLTVSVLLKIGAVFGVDMQRFADNDEAHLIAELREIAPRLADFQNGSEASAANQISLAEIKELAANMPAVARALVGLHHRFQQTVEQLEGLRQQWGGERPDRESLAVMQPVAYEEVRDFFFARSNHIAVLDDAAEAFARNWKLPAGAAAIDELTGHLQRRHDVRTVYHLPGMAASAQSQAALVRRYDPISRILTLDASLSPGQKAFQLATQFALLEMGECIGQLVADTSFVAPQSRNLTRIGLANYYAGALLLPYTDFLHAAQQCRYDIEMLASRYGVGFETICHRLSTLQRAYNRGIPFFFIRVDRAGNISKRQSATHFHFSKIGGTCPLWNVYEAFSQPGRIVVQVAAMPDGRTYLWVARTVTHRGHGWGKPGKNFSVALGCDIRHAEELVYSQGLNLRDPSAAVPIGMGCKVCDRQGCVQRAFPPIGKPLDVDENQSLTLPYNVGQSRNAAPSVAQHPD
ncbi:short-chain fatty acyl-CoA regulator family protein [Lampropedia hyalina]|jgi:predicted transcriptional regulator/transcriptional regulator with XRE-family HTH domain|nr:short-chain fatty acyl-CoA regulator family protein [Lampropedia hyalina]